MQKLLYEGLQRPAAKSDWDSFSLTHHCIAGSLWSTLRAKNLTSMLCTLSLSHVTAKMFQRALFLPSGLTPITGDQSGLTGNSWHLSAISPIFNFAETFLISDTGIAHGNSDRDKKNPEEEARSSLYAFSIFYIYKSCNRMYASNKDCKFARNLEVKSPIWRKMNLRNFPCIQASPPKIKSLVSVLNLRILIASYVIWWFPKCLSDIMMFSFRVRVGTLQFIRKFRTETSDFIFMAGG